MTVVVVGRDVEVTAVSELLDIRGESGPAGLVLWGQAGIGKSTIWRVGVDGAHQREYRVLACRPAQAELRLSYSGLTDLLVDVDPVVLNGLAGPQRRALDAALLLGSSIDVAPDQRAVAAAFLSVLNACASVRPTLVAIDDVQWLDGSTRRVVEYAVRRSRGRVIVLVTERADKSPGSASWLCTPDPSRMATLHVSGLSVGALHSVVRQETGRSFPRPTMVRIAELSAGNPFYAVEVARSLVGRPAGLSSLPTSADHVVRDHLAGLDPSVRDALLVASAVADPTLPLLRRVCGQPDIVGLLTPAEDSGLVEWAGVRVRFTHPLWASAVYSGTSTSQRRALHRQLSAHVDDVEERARHLALAATELDDATEQALAAAADHARSRGSASAAAELAELAFDLGATAPARRIRAAGDHFDADDPVRARELLTAVIAELGPGRERAEALRLLGTIVYESENFFGSIETLEQAFREAGDDTRLRCLISLELSFVLAHSGSIAAASSYIAVAVEEAGEIDDGLLAEVLAVSVVLRVLQGDEVDTAQLDRALALEDPDRRVHALQWPSFNAAALRMWRHDVEGAGAAFGELHVRCVERGAESDLWLVLGQAMQVALWSGDVGTAEAYAKEMAERARMSAGESVQALAAGSGGIVAAWRGDVDTARRVLPAALTALAPSRFTTAALYALAALGMLELSVGNHAEAAGYLAPAAAQLSAVGFRDPEVVPIGPDAVEALIALGRLDEAAPLVELLESTGQRPGRDWARAVGARCTGLVRAAAGDLDGAAEAYARAVEAHRRLPLLRYDYARTLLVLGQLQRRRRERRAARSSLQQAVRLFEEVGAARWATSARGELDRVGLHPGPPDRLTPAEARVALLAGTGRTNREIAGLLFVSAKTVEAHLARVYRKLGIHSRAELGRRMANDEPQAKQLPM